MPFMNQVFFIATACCCFNLYTTNGFGQAASVNEGVLKYEVNIDAQGESVPDDMKDFKPEINISFKEERALLVFSGVPEFEGNMIMVDGKKHEAHLGVKRGDEKYHVVVPEETLKREQQENMAKFDSMDAMMQLFMPDDSTDTTNPAMPGNTVRTTGETETILGYECRKYTAAAAFMQFEFYTTESVHLPSSLLGMGNMASGTLGGFDFSQIKGFPLKINIRIDMFGQQASIQLLANSLKKETIDEKIFKIPNDYKQISYEEFKAMGIH